MADFGLVLKVLLAGGKARLPGWDDGMYLKMNKLIPGIVSHDFITVYSISGITPWSPTQHSILSDKWEFIE